MAKGSDQSRPGTDKWNKAGGAKSPIKQAQKIGKAGSAGNGN